MTLAWLIYFSFAELLSWMPSSQASLCILISEEANSKDYSGDHACATMHEAIFRFARYVWDNASHDNVVAFGTILIALFTYVLYRSTNKLWDAGERQLDHLETTSQRQLRAYVVANPKGVDIRGPENETSVTFQIVIKNTGQTPAHELTIVSMTELLEHPIRMPFDFTLTSGPDPSRDVLGAGEIIESDSRAREPFDGNAMMIARERDAGARIYTWGCVTYRDVFGHQWHTNFCSSLLFDEDGRPYGHASEHHNDAS